MKKSDKILLLSSMVLVGFILSIVAHYVLNVYFKFPDNAFGNFVWPVKAHFDDFNEIVLFIKNSYLNPTDYILNMYLKHSPFLFILFFPLALIPNTYFAYFIFACIFLIYFTSFNIRYFKCNNFIKSQNFQNIFILTFLSYPVLFLLDKGNFNILIFMFFIAFICSYRLRNYYLSAFFLALINIIQPYFIVFSLLFLFKKKFVPFLLNILLSILLFLSGFFVLNNDLTTSLISFKYIIIYQITEIINNYHLVTNSFSLLEMFKLLFGKDLSLFLITILCNYFLIIITLFVLFFVYKERVFWKKITLLTFLTLLLPYIVFDYQLVFLFVPIWFFVNSRIKNNLDIVYALLFSFLLLPKPFGIIINPLLILLFAFMIIWEQINQNNGVENEQNG